VIGSVAGVKKQLEQLTTESEADEIIIMNMITDKEARHKSINY